MSIDINWETLTGGTDGIALAETVRSFIHDKFQQVTLPRFIRSVKVHSFDFGSVAPEVEIKDICDPLPDFYEEDEEEEEEREGSAGSGEDDGAARELSDAAVAATATAEEASNPPLRERPSKAAEDRRLVDKPNDAVVSVPTGSRPLRSFVDGRPPGLRSGLASPLLSRAPTPGIPGGTSNMSYFHLPLGAGLSGTTTPLAAVAGAQFQGGWPEHNSQPRHATSVSSSTPPSSADPSSRPSSQHQHESSRRDSQAGIAGASWQDHERDRTPSPSVTPQLPDRSVEDIQIISHVKYSGDIKMSLTAEILLDYPMPSFVGIPLKLNITGLSFDGVAILAYIKKRAHFCFLSPEDADAVVGGDTGDEYPSPQPRTTEQQSSRRQHIGGLLEHIKVESEIGQKENGKQVLKNVGKVEKFVLEQVRRIFEDEFVYPSFWTFLV